MDLTKDELERLKLIQHSMALEGHTVSLEDLIAAKKVAKEQGTEEKLELALSRGKEEGISNLEAIQKYFNKN